MGSGAEMVARICAGCDARRRKERSPVPRIVCLRELAVLVGGDAVVDVVGPASCGCVRVVGL